MQILSRALNIDFMSKRKFSLVVSVVLLVISIGSLATRGLNYGIDFTGGYLIEVGYENTVDINSVRKLLADNGFGDAVVQNFGTPKDILVRLAPRGGIEKAEAAAEISDKVFDVLKQGDSTANLRRVEFVGPQIGDELKNDGGIAMLIALFCIMIYVMMRFEKRFSIGAVAALIHDVIITLGVFSVIHANFDLTVLAAVLAVIGYSLNDTIVVYDRIRENFSKIRKATTIEIINSSVNQTLARTLVTSMTTLIVLLSLFILGGEIIHSFALALIVGVLIGTYSSIFVASPIVLALGLTREDMLPPKKEGADMGEADSL